MAEYTQHCNYKKIIGQVSDAIRAIGADDLDLALDQSIARLGSRRHGPRVRRLHGGDNSISVSSNLGHNVFPYAAYARSRLDVRHARRRHNVAKRQPRHHAEQAGAHRYSLLLCLPHWTRLHDTRRPG